MSTWRPKGGGTHPAQVDLRGALSIHQATLAACCSVMLLGLTPAGCMAGPGDEACATAARLAAAGADGSRCIDSGSDGRIARSRAGTRDGSRVSPETPANVPPPARLDSAESVRRQHALALFTVDRHEEGWLVLVSDDDAVPVFAIPSSLALFEAKEGDQVELDVFPGPGRSAPDGTTRRVYGEIRRWDERRVYCVLRGEAVELPRGLFLPSLRVRAVFVLSGRAEATPARTARAARLRAALTPAHASGGAITLETARATPAGKEAQASLGPARWPRLQ